MATKSRSREGLYIEVEIHLNIDRFCDGKVLRYSKENGVKDSYDA